MVRYAILIIIEPIHINPKNISMPLSTDPPTDLPVAPATINPAVSEPCGYRVNTHLEHGSGEINEDALLVQGDTFGVFDGATGLTQNRFSGNVSGGYLAANLASNIFAGSGENLFALAEKANSSIRSAQQQAGVFNGPRHLFWSTSLAVVRLGQSHLEYCQTGDSQILLIHGDGSFSLPAPDVDIDRETLLLMRELSVKNSRKELSEQIRKVRLEMNRSYGVLNGEPEAMNFINHGCVDLGNVTDILLFTDGLFLPKADPRHEQDWQRFVELYSNGGLFALRDCVRGLQGIDPERRLFPRFKCHDDMAAVAITLQPPPQKRTSDLALA